MHPGSAQRAAHMQLHRLHRPPVGPCASALFIPEPPSPCLSAPVPQLHEKIGYHAVQGLRSIFDYFTG